MTLPTALAAPVLEGMMLAPQARPPLQSLPPFAGPSTHNCDMVTAWTVVISPSPVFTALRGSINTQLRHGHGVDGGHKSLLDSPVVVEHLGDGGKAVSSARRVGDDIHVGLVQLVVNSHDKDGGVILWWCGKHNLLGSTSDMSVGAILGEEDTGGLTDEVSTVLAPWNGGWVSLGCHRDKVVTDHNSAFGLGNLVFESPVDGVVLEKVHQIVNIHEGVVDLHDAGFVRVGGES